MGQSCNTEPQKKQEFIPSRKPGRVPTQVPSADLTQGFYRHPDRFAESNHEDFVWLRRVAIAKRAA